MALSCIDIVIRKFEFVAKTQIFNDHSPLFLFPSALSRLSPPFSSTFLPSTPVEPLTPSIVIFHPVSKNFLKSPFPFFFPCQAFLRPVSPCTPTSFRLSPADLFLRPFFPTPSNLSPSASDLSSTLLHTFPMCLRPFFLPSTNLSPPLP